MKKKNHFVIKRGSIGESEQVHICSVGLVALGVDKGELFTSKSTSLRWCFGDSRECNARFILAC